MSIIDSAMGQLPYIKQFFSDPEMQNVNRKFDLFSDASITKEKQIQRLSVVNKYDHEMEIATNGGMMPLIYSQLMYGATSNDKKRRLDDFRSMSQYPEVESALREICDEFFVKDEQGEMLKCALRGDFNDDVKALIEKEFQKHCKIFKFDDRGWRYIYDFITEGELFFENVVSIEKPELGIIGLTRIQSERIDPLYYDMDNELIDSFILRPKQASQYPYQWGKGMMGNHNSQNQQQLIFLNDKQVSYVSSDIWEPQNKKYKIPHLATAHRPYRHLSLIEDATIIYMLVRAPERLVFNIDTGNLPPAKQEQYMQRLMARFWTKKTIGNNGQVENTYDPQGMLENYYFAQPRDGKGSTVSSIGGGKQSPDNLEILNFFVQKLYRSLHIPVSRLNTDSVFSTGENITIEELRFARFIISIQKLWASAVKNSFIVHMKLKGRKLLEVAKKLQITQLNLGDKQNPNMMAVNQIYKEEFTTKCWDYYDLLTDQIDENINLRETYIAEQRLKLIEELDEAQMHMNVLFEQIAKDDAEVVTEETENLKLELDVLQKKEKMLSEQLADITQMEIETKSVKEDSQSWWDQYDLTEESIDVEFVKPTQFHALREQQMFQLKYDNFNNMSQNDMIDNIFAQKVYLGYKDNQILANIEFLRRGAALRWELAQIEQNGPDFREKALKEMEGTMGGEEDFSGLPGMDGGGGGLPSGGDGGAPAFGDAPEGAEGGEAGGEGEAPADDGGKPPTAPTGESTQNSKRVILENVAKYDPRLLDQAIRASLKLMEE
jgi:hypothetical protein